MLAAALVSQRCHRFQPSKVSQQTLPDGCGDAGSQFGPSVHSASPWNGGCRRKRGRERETDMEERLLDVKIQGEPELAAPISATRARVERDEKENSVHLRRPFCQPAVCIVDLRFRPVGCFRRGEDALKEGYDGVSDI